MNLRDAAIGLNALLVMLCSGFFICHLLLQDIIV